MILISAQYCSCRSIYFCLHLFSSHNYCANIFVDIAGGTIDPLNFAVKFILVRKRQNTNCTNVRARFIFGKKKKLKIYMDLEIRIHHCLAETGRNKSLACLKGQVQNLQPDLNFIPEITLTM